MVDLAEAVEDVVAAEPSVGRAAASVTAMVPHLSPCHRVRQVVTARAGATRAVAAAAAVARVTAQT